MNVGDLGKFIVAKCFELLPKVQKITQSGHTDHFTQYGTPHMDFEYVHNNFQDEISLMTPLHLAVYSYHADHAEATCEFIDALLKAGADPTMLDKSGETAPNLAVVKTRDMQVMAKVNIWLLIEKLKVFYYTLVPSRYNIYLDSCVNDI